MTKTHAIICDLDGTLCNIQHRVHWVNPGVVNSHGKLKKRWDKFFEGIPNDAVNENVLDVINMFTSVMGYSLVFCSGRPESCREKTIDWLANKCEVYAYQLCMRPNKDNRQDAIVKEELYRTYIEPVYDVKLVLDDRKQVVQKWRSLGLECWAVAEGDF